MSFASSNRQTADVIILGGGVIGCGVAYELARRSVDVLLIDKSLPGRASSASAGGRSGGAGVRDHSPQIQQPR